MLTGFTRAIWDEAFIEGEPLSGLGLGESVSVYLGNDSGSIKELLGTINGTALGMSDPWQLGFDGDIFATLAQDFASMSQPSGDVALYFEGGGSLTELNSFLWGVNGQPIPVPEATAAAMLATIALAALNRRRARVA
jgi:hypothetical protein